MDRSDLDALAGAAGVRLDQCLATLLRSGQLDELVDWDGVNACMPQAIANTWRKCERQAMVITFKEDLGREWPFYCSFSETGVKALQAAITQQIPLRLKSIQTEAEAVEFEGAETYAYLCSKKAYGLREDQRAYMAQWEKDHNI